MGLFSKHKSPSPNETIVLVDILRRCRELVSASKDSDWSCMDVADISTSIDEAIEALTHSRAFDVLELRVLFTPTGPLQETSMSNGWADDYLVLAERFDDAIKPWT